MSVSSYITSFGTTALTSADMLLEAASLAQVEIAMFFMAAICYVVFNGAGAILPANTPGKGKLAEFEPPATKEKNRDQSPANESLEEERVSKALQLALQSKDHTQVLRLWQKVKTLRVAPGGVSLGAVADSLLKNSNRDTAFVVRELSDGFEKNAGLQEANVVQALLEALVKSGDLGLMEAVLRCFRSMNLLRDPRGYEMLLDALLAKRSFQRVESICNALNKAGPASSHQGITKPMQRCLTAARLALHKVSAREALRQLQKHRASRPAPATVGGGYASGRRPPRLPAVLCSELLAAACGEEDVGTECRLRQGVLCEAITELAAGHWTLPAKEAVSIEVVELVFETASRRRDRCLARDVDEFFFGQLKLSKRIQTYTLLLQALPADGERLRSLFQEMIVDPEKALVTEGVAIAFLRACQAAREGALVSEVLTSLARSPAVHKDGPGFAVCAAAVRALHACEEFEKACDLYEEMLSRGVMPDPELAGVLLQCAVKAQRTRLTEELFEKSRMAGDMERKHLTMIRALGKAGDLAGAEETFTRWRESGASMTAQAYNVIMEACAQCGEPKRCLVYLEESRKNGCLDAVSFNTAIKAHLMAGDFSGEKKANALLSEMKEAGLRPNQVTYHELLNAAAARGPAGAWKLLEEIETAGVAPNGVTCAIMMKTLHSSSRDIEVERALALLEQSKEPMDEVLLSTVVEALLRTGRSDRLAGVMERYAKGGGALGCGGLSAPAYGSLIKAYGQTRDVDRVWALWNDLTERGVKISAMTVGCMVEALVQNGQVEQAYTLVTERLPADKGVNAEGLVNCVVFSTLLKGFTQSQQLLRAWKVLEEMKRRGLERNLVTYNTMMDACARAGGMDRMEELMTRMEEDGVQPDRVTYATAVKGLCTSGELDKAFAVYRRMRADEKKEGEGVTTVKPDEILYNSLLEGCAKANRTSDALSLYAEMEEAGVRPTNYTLTSMVKLLGRARRLPQALKLVEELPRKHNFSANVQVYTCLLQACLNNKSLQKAFQIHDKMAKLPQAQPDARTYAALARGCVQLGNLERTAEVIRRAYGLLGGGPVGEQLQAPKKAPGMPQPDLEQSLRALCQGDNSEALGLPLLQELRNKGVRMESGLQAMALRQATARQRQD